MSEKTCVVFLIATQKYCVDILKVNEICMNKESIVLPNVPNFVEGVINLRGSVLCIMNLAKKLNTKSFVDKKSQKIIVTKIKGMSVGFLVDEVDGILHTNDDYIEDAPKIISEESDFVQGIIKNGDDMVIELDFDRVLSQKEISEIEEISDKQVD